MYHVLTNADKYPPNIGTIVPRAMIDCAGGEKNFLTIPLSDELKIHRRRDFGRVRNPVNGRRGFKTSKFHTLKVEGKPLVMSESFTGERWRNNYFEIAPSIRKHWDQRFIVELHDDAGVCWAVPDSYLEGNDDSFAFCEGKTCLFLETLPDGSKKLLRGLPEETHAKVLRIQEAFDRAGYHYEVFDQAWSAHPIRVSNIKMILSAVRKLPFGATERIAMERLLGRNDLTVGQCAREFIGRGDCAEEWVCAAMGRGVLEIELDRLIDRDSRVSCPSAPFWSTP